MSTHNLQPYERELPDPIDAINRVTPDGHDYDESVFTATQVRAIMADAHQHYEAQVRQLGGLALTRKAEPQPTQCDAEACETGCACPGDCIAQARPAGNAPQPYGDDCDPKFTVGDLAAKVGAWETAEGFVSFGSWQAVAAFHHHILSGVAKQRAQMHGGAQPSGDAACPVVAVAAVPTSEFAPVQVTVALSYRPSDPEPLIRQRDHLAAVAAKDARIAALTLAISRSCDDERSHVFDTGGGTGCERAGDAERRVSELESDLAERDARIAVLDRALQLSIDRILDKPMAMTDEQMASRDACIAEHMQLVSAYEACVSQGAWSAVEASARKLAGIA